MNVSQLKMSPASTVATIFGLEEGGVVEYLKTLPHTVRYLRRLNLTVVFEYCGALETYSRI